MIPPSKEVRLRSIIRWMKDNNPQAASLPPGELDKLAQEKDDVMMEAFDAEDNRITWEASQAKRGLTMDQYIQEVNTGKLEAWQEIVADMLPTLSPATAD